LPFADLKSVYAKERKQTDDPVLLFALFSRMKDICIENKYQSMCAPFCGLHMDFFICTLDGKEFSSYYETDYEGLGDYYPIVSSCVNYLDEYGRVRRFLCEKNTKVRVTGKRLLFGKDIIIEEFQKELYGLESLLIQHECDNIAQNFVVNSGIEVEINNYAS
jgi:hypothetical protein